MSAGCAGSTVERRRSGVVLRNRVQSGDTAVRGEPTREPDLFVSAIRFGSRPERALIEALPSRYPIDDQRPRNNAFAEVERSRRMVATLATANPSRREANRMDRMKEKVVVVTGAAHGIGAAIARRFAGEGAALALLDLDATRLAQTADQLPGSPPLTLVADVTEEAAVDDAFAQIVTAHKRIDVPIPFASLFDGLAVAIVATIRRLSSTSAKTLFRGR
jgi:hypothetical protein